MMFGSDGHISRELRLEAVAFRDQLPGENVHIFSEQGGSIGRSEDNDFVLPDTESVVSRLHATIRYEGGEYYWDDKSTNGTFVNDSVTRLAESDAYLINDGDRFQVGDYTLVAKLIALADTLSNAPTDDQAVTHTAVHMDLDSEQSDNDAEGNEALPEFDGWPSMAKRPNWFPVGEGEDFETDKDTPSFAESQRERPPVSILKQHMAQPYQTPKPVTKPEKYEQDQSEVSHGNAGIPTGYIPGASQFETSFGEELVPGGPDQEEPASSLLLGDEEISEPSAFDESNEAAPVKLTGDADSAANPLPESSQPDSDEKAEEVPPPETGFDGAVPALKKLDADLLAALLDGLGTDTLQITPDQAAYFAKQVGQLVREAVQGMIDTLRLRDEFKREFYVPVTRIAPSENNLFKHSANVDDGLFRAFSGVASSAYLDPVESTRQAFQDIAAHQLALVAGMQASVTYLLECFSPQALQERIGKSGVLDGMFPHVRKAHMWEQFEKEYTKIAEQVEEDFQRVFGQHFERAYTKQISQLNDAGFGGHKDPKT
ncbi:MAG: type VI secretion system-associated FHA domain protein TagH [Chromatiales bacterium]|jgi:type VI secretion system protein